MCSSNEKSTIFRKKNIKYMYLICRETLSEKINFGFIDNWSLDANFSALATFVFLLSLIFKKTRYPK